jgi:hypothetical protein
LREPEECENGEEPLQKHKDLACSINEAQLIGAVVGTVELPIPRVLELDLLTFKNLDLLRRRQLLSPKEGVFCVFVNSVLENFTVKMERVHVVLV